MKGDWKRIGSVGVGSGMLMICDPCYIDDQWKKTEFDESKKAEGEFSYNGCAQATLTKERSGQLNYTLGHAGAGVAFSSGWGDGEYIVYAKICTSGESKGRIMAVKVIMIDSEEE